ncbi:hypothetical protein ACWIUD_05875 [Helicobacter sp. 23-1044]
MSDKDYKTYRDISIFAILNICFLICVFSPFALYSSDVTQFDATQTTSTLCALAGFFILTSGAIIYTTSFFYKTRLLKIGTFAFCVVLSIGFVYCFVLVGDYGAMEQMMFLDTSKIYHKNNKFIDLAIGILSCVAMFLVLYFAKHIFLKGIKIMFLSIVALSFISLSQILLAQNASKIAESNSKNSADSAILQNPNPHFSAFSKDGLNIIVFMLDAFTGSHFKILQEENPALLTMLDGFIHYDNTTTASSFTHTSLPSVFGGDYFSSYQINARGVADLESERDSAIINIASNFLQKGFRVDFDIYAVNEANITKNLANPNFSMKTNNHYYKTAFEKTHNFALADILAEIKADLNVDALLSYGIFRNAPYSLRTRILLVEEARWRIHFGEVRASSHSLNLATHHISQLGTIIDNVTLGANKPTLKFIASGLTHDSFVVDDISCLPTLYPKAKLPQKYRDLIPKMFWGKYNSEVCAMREIGRFIDKLKNLGIYDRTMIVIVSDHGRADSYPQLKIAGNNFPGYYTDTLLLVKNPHARGEMKSDSRLMINSDVASLICEYIGGCEKVPPNPLKNYPQNREVVHFHPKYFQGNKNPKDKYAKEAVWKVRGDIYNPQNWEKID